MIPVFLGCETSEDLGIKYQLDSSASVKYVEFTLPATNIYVDSLRTDGENSVLAGNFTDNITGTVSAEGYFQYSYERGPLPNVKVTKDEPNPPDTLKIDSLILLLDTEAIIPRASDTYQEFSIHELNDDLINGAVYLSGLKQEMNATSIANFSSAINSTTDNLFRLKFDDSYATAFYQNISDINKDTLQFMVSATFKNLAVVPGALSESIAQFDLDNDSSRIIAYTSPVSPDSKDTTYVTTFKFSGKNYSYLDRSQSTYENVGDKVEFNLAGGETLIDPLYGITTIHNIAELATFFDANENIIINNATISFAFESEASRDTLKSFYHFFNRENGYFAPSIVINPFSNLVMSDQGYLNGQSNPALSALNSDKTTLNVNATLFFQTLYNNYDGELKFSPSLNSEAFTLSEFAIMSSADVSLRRTIIGNDGIKLKIYYTQVD